MIKLPLPTVILLGLFAMMSGAVVAETAQPAANVNPWVGTGRGPAPDPDSSYENLFPGATLTFGAPCSRRKPSGHAGRHPGQ